MKKLFIFLVSLCISCEITAQTSLDMLLFERINDYRIENKIKPLEWDSAVYKMAEHHTRYLFSYVDDGNYTTFISTHNEDVDVSSFVEINTINERFKKYVGEEFSSLKENVFSGAIDTIFKKEIPPKYMEEYLSNSIFKAWKNSKSHNRTMLDSNLTYAACSVENGMFDNNMGYLKPIIEGATLNAYQP